MGAPVVYVTLYEEKRSMLEVQFKLSLVMVGSKEDMNGDLRRATLFKFTVAAMKLFQSGKAIWYE